MRIHESQKDLLYHEISDGLRQIVIPVVAKYSPTEMLTRLSRQRNVEPKEYISLVVEAIKDGKAMAEMARYMDEFLTKIDASVDDFKQTTVNTSVEALK